ncbi:hypothetical protein ACQ94K_23220, partial [Escherichia coli]
TVCVVGKIRDLILQLSKSSIYSTKPIKSNSGYITLGGMDEAIYYVNHNIKPWIRTSGAIDWIVNNSLSKI